MLENGVLGQAAQLHVGEGPRVETGKNIISSEKEGYTDISQRQAGRRDQRGRDVRNLETVVPSRH